MLAAIIVNISLKNNMEFVFFIGEKYGLLNPYIAGGPFKTGATQCQLKI